MDLSAAYPDGTTNYSSMISQFKATVAKVLLFPPDAYALGNLVNNVATDAWWAPSLPWTSSFTGETCQQLATDFESSTNGQWNSNISNYSLFEAAHEALTSVS